MKSSTPRPPIDWPNHLIAFFSALFGILIAFGLEEWRDERSQKELAQLAFENLRKEIQMNHGVLHESVKNNKQHLTDFMSILTSLNNELSFNGTRKEADSINQHFNKIIFIDTKATITPQPLPVFLSMGNLNIPSLQTSAWESAKATGALTWMEYEKVLSLSSVYNDSRIVDELAEIKRLWRSSEKIKNKNALSTLLSEMLQAHLNLERELEEFDTFVNMLNAMD